MSTVSKSKLTTLELIYTPISNQEAEWLRVDAEVEARIRQSDFYMIAGRAEAWFDKIDFDAAAGLFRFELVIGDEFRDVVALDPARLPGVAADEGTTILFESGPKLIRLWDRSPDEDGAKLLEWFTPEKLIFDRGRGRPGVLGLDRHAEAATYDLLYVGIAKVGDTFDRLIDNGHQARMRILANEPQRYPGARVTDETYLFKFRVLPTVISTFALDHEFTDADFGMPVDLKAVVADAEKAYVSLLRPEYNSVLFKAYPKGGDGLYGAGLERYGYAICENLSFNTAHGRVRGGRDPLTDFLTPRADAIFVEGTEVKFFASGVDFPET